MNGFTVDVFRIPVLTREQVRAKQVSLWGEDKVAANELDVALRFGRGIDTGREAHGRPLVECAEPGCHVEFYHVPARGERAPFCLDHAAERYGTEI